MVAKFLPGFGGLELSKQQDLSSLFLRAVPVFIRRKNCFEGDPG